MDIPSSFPAGAMVLRMWPGNEHVPHEGFCGCDVGDSGPQLQSWNLKQKDTENRVDTHHYSRHSGVENGASHVGYDHHAGDEGMEGPRP
jgi:hypothetical protein